jgi:pimeloyl-ACP methyl ester carboxylesterase
MAQVDLDAARRFAAECLATLEADVRFYTTSEAARDLDDVRRAIGAERINLVGISYGTRVAQEYLRRFPAQTRSVVLDGVVPPTLALGADHAKNLDAALRLQFQRCESDPVCSDRFGSPWDSLQQLLAELRGSPRRVEFRDPLTHSIRQAEFTPETVVAVSRLFAYSPQLAAMLPMVLADALAGRPETLMSQAQMIEDLLGEQIMHGMQLSVGCSEDADLLQPDPADAGSLLGTYFVEFIKTQCEVWPRGSVPADFHAPLVSDRPVLLLSGELDPVTPPRYGDEARRGLSNSRHLVLPGAGHNVLGDGCLPQLMARFIETNRPEQLEAACVDDQVRTPPFAGTYGWDP